MANGALSYHYTQLRQSTSTPSVQLHFPETPGGDIDASDVAVDKNGNLWVANDISNSVVEYTPASIAASGTPTPAVTLTGAGLTSAYSLAFDAQGNLWVGEVNVGRVVELTPAQLTASGSPTPAVMLGDSLNAVSSASSDRADVRWARQSLGGQREQRNPFIQSGQLARTGNPSPAVTLSGSFDISGMAFDPNGNLWVADPNSFLKPDSTVPPPQAASWNLVSLLDVEWHPRARRDVDASGGRVSAAPEPSPSIIAAISGSSTLTMPMSANSKSQLSASGSPKPTVSLTNPSPASSESA